MATEPEATRLRGVDVDVHEPVQVEGPDRVFVQRRHGIGPRVPATPTLT
jgi:hypothetical protein